MIIYRNECVGCPPERGCLGDACPNRNVPVCVCDECGDEVSELYYGADGGQYCKHCVIGNLERVNVE